MEQNHQEEKRIRRINRELKYQGAIVDIYSDTIETPDGLGLCGTQKRSSSSCAGYTGRKNLNGTPVS